MQDEEEHRCSQCYLTGNSNKGGIVGKYFCLGLIKEPGDKQQK